MNSSLYTGVLGLEAHQIKMDVIGNNIANVNTYGYKKGRATFADLLSRTYSAATAPGDTTGGTNPIQVGLGVTVSAITNLMIQGQTETTGVSSDAAIAGNGWFVLANGTGQQVYTRDGTFTLDKDGSFVSDDGWYVQGWSTVIQDKDNNFTINNQTATDNIQFTLGEKLEAEATTIVSLACNLDSESSSVISDGEDATEGYAKGSTLLVDLYATDVPPATSQYNPASLSIREGDWVEVHANVTYADVKTTGQTAALGTGTDVNANGNLWRYTGAVDEGELPMTNLDTTALDGIAAAGQTYNDPDWIAAQAAAGTYYYSIDPDTGIVYVGAPTGTIATDAASGTGAAITFDTQSSCENTLPYEEDKYLYFQVTPDTTISDLEAAIQNSLDALDVNGTGNYKVSYDTDTAQFVISNNAVSGSSDYNNLSVEINAVSGSGIREAYLLQDSTAKTVRGTSLGIVDGNLAGEMTREQVTDFDYQTSVTNLDYGNIDGSAQIYGQVLLARLEQAYDSATYGGVLDLADWTGYTAGGELEALNDTYTLTVDGTTWSQVKVFTGAANEYRVALVSSATGNPVPEILFNTTGGLEPADTADVILTYRTDPDTAPINLLVKDTDYTIDSATGQISLIWSNSTSSSVFGVSSAVAGEGGGFTGTIRLTAEYTTEDRAMAPESEIMNSRWSDFAQEYAEVTSGGDGAARTAFNSMFSGINAATISDQGTSAQPTSKISSTFLAGNTYRTSIEVFDSLGTAHTLELVFTNIGSNYDLLNQQVNTNRWAWRAELSYDDVFAFDSMDSVDDDYAAVRNNGELTFDADGLLIESKLPFNTGPIMFDPSPIGANGNSTHSIDTLSIDLNIDGDGDLTNGITQYASDSTTSAYEQNGWAMGTLVSYGIDANGVIQGTYSNNVVKPIAQIALAMFANESGLVKNGDNTFSISANSGLAHILHADSGGAGTITGGALEMSNVDIVEEFAAMIVTERGFQANSRIITTSDEMLTEVINLKR
jgi:flagellar hook protein FlgE